MPLRLHKTAHDPKRANRLATPRQKGRNDGMVWTLARGERVGMTGIQAEVVPTILQRHARAWHDDSRAKAHIVALNEGHHVTLAVRCAQIHSTTRLRPRRGQHEGIARDARSQPSDEVLRQELTW